MRRYFDIEHYREFSAGSSALSLSEHSIEDLLSKPAPDMSIKYMIFKTFFDFGCAIVAIPLIAFMSLLLLLINPFFNPGPLFFNQERVGQFGKPFRMWKFRTMVPAKFEARDPTASLEENRITKLGRILRKTRLDEIPNLINVLLGDMSVVGPRPEAASHAEYYAERVLGYSERQRVKPGITGLAQVEQGYVENESQTSLKVTYDNLYVERMCGRLDVYVISRTFRVMFGGIGAK